jgi:hypothetical protein
MRGLSRHFGIERTARCLSVDDTGQARAGEA